jgi:hypothetical protein
MDKVEKLSAVLEKASFDERWALAGEVEKVESEWADVRVASQRVLGKKAKLG